jgi:hypothetical protein
LPASLPVVHLPPTVGRAGHFPLSLAGFDEAPEPVTVALGALCIVQWQQLAHQQTQLRGLRAEAEQNSKQIAALEFARKRSNQQWLMMDQLDRPLVRQMGLSKSEATSP